MPRSASEPAAGAPRQLFNTTPGERVALARRQFFEEGLRPTGLVGEAVIQSWMRCVRSHGDTRRMVSFDPVTTSRLHASLNRHRELLDAAAPELRALEQSLAGTGCRVILTDAEGVVLHATQHTCTSAQPVLQRTARAGVNICEAMVGTTAPGIVARTGQACTVDGAEHYFEVLRELQCAAAPIRDVQGRLAAVLDLTVEGRCFGFDAAAVTGLFATAIENRLLRAQSSEHLVLSFQASPALLGTPMEALAGIAPDGTVAWLNGAGAALLGRLPADAPARGVEQLLGLDLATLMRLGRRDMAQPLRLASGLGVWAQARLRASDGVDFRHAVATGDVPADTPAAPDGADAAPPPVDTTAPPQTAPADGAPAETLRAHSRRLIEDTLAAHGGNLSQAARQLRISRGTLYRHLKRWPLGEEGGPPDAEVAGPFGPG